MTQALPLVKDALPFVKQALLSETSDD